MNESINESTNKTPVADQIEDANTARTLTDDERKAAEERLTENLQTAEDKEKAIRKTLAEIRTARENKAAELKTGATYQETKTLEAILNTIRDYRDKRYKTLEAIKAIEADETYSTEYKTKLINEQSAKLQERTAAAEDATLELMAGMVKAREEYDRAFFTDPARFEAASRVITALKTAGNNLTARDFTNLVYPLYGDTAAARYVLAAVKDAPLIYKGVLEEMNITPEKMFFQSKRQLAQLFNGSYTAYDIERLLIKEAEAVGISTTVTDYSEPIFSEKRNKALTPEISKEELEAHVKKAFGIR